MTDSSTDKNAQARARPEESPMLPILASLEDIFSLLNSTVELAQVEAKLALRNIPRIIALSFLSPLLLTLSWLSASVTVSWFVADLYQHTGWGLLCFTLCQSLGYLIIRLRLKALKSESSLPHTREHLRLVRNMTVSEKHEKAYAPSSVTT